ncbi:MAG: type II secretion system protein [Victivallales bacterium]|nr:type II secretion system protein [Victivallales bacterium]
MKKNSFTLVELLTVIAIIAVLAGMLMPALSKARSKAAAINCVANQKQIMTTAIMYSNDNKQRLPYSTSNDMNNWWTQSNDSYNGSWCGKIYQIVLEPKVFLCNNANESSTNFTDDKYGVSYSIVREISLLKMTRMDNPASAIYVFDNDTTNNLARYEEAAKGSTGDDAKTINSTWKTNLETYDAVHDEKLNAGFVDGHAATYRVADLINQNVVSSGTTLNQDYRHK